MTTHYLPNIIRFIFIASAGFALTLLSASWLSLSVVQFWMKLDSKQYIARVEHNYIHEKSYLSALVLPNTCSDNVRHILHKIEHEEPELRFVGLVLNKQTLCTSNGILSHPIELQPTTYPLFRYFSESTGQEEIAVMIDGVSNNFVVFINKIRLVDYLHFYCESCISYQIKLVGEAAPVPLDSTWFIIVHDYGQARGYLHVSNTLKKQVNDKYFWFYFLMYCVMFSLLLFTYKLYRNRSLSVEALLIQAAKKQQFIPFYQPIVTPEGKVKGVEALMRWQDNSGAILAPNTFIHTAEKLGVIDDMTLGMINKAKDDFNHHSGSAQLPLNFFCAFNLTASQIENDDFVDKLLLTFAGYQGFIAAFEITERQKFNDEEAAKRNLGRLQSDGYQIKLDDTGTGYGGFNYFLHFNIDSIKIDKMFIDIIGREDLKINVLNAIIDMAKSLELTIIAEGVETQTQVDFLSEKGVDLLQGYYFSKPVPYDKLNVEGGARV
ncbi:EAL domain-containing protein [Moritella sp. 28]|uniref:EAL domain-containing protein n=1 Tax=Moritella sp. 28 TaxID=2746232 RepID=UPI001BA94A76|nr:EAL domain-containing protein [Moritella sp. 28]QUM83761.1 EAL domain-containing protein [Moritella sp. 28]